MGILNYVGTKMHSFMEIKNPTEKAQDGFFNELLDSIKPTDEEYIERRISHINFAKIISWLCITSTKRPSFTRKDLRSFIRLADSRVFDILEGLISAGMLEKKSISSIGTIYKFLRDDHGVRITKYFDKALKTLGKKPRLEIKFEDDLDDKDLL